MAVYTDDFQGNIGDDLDVYDSTWVDIGPDADSIQIADGGAGARYIAHDSGNNGGYYYNQTFDSKHYSELEVKDNGSYIGPVIRCQAGGNYFYCFMNSGGVYNGEMVSGSPTDWDGGQAGCSNNDVGALYVDETTETTIIYKLNDSTIQTYVSKGNLSGGRPGVGIAGGGEADNWEGGDVAAGGETLSVNLSGDNVSYWRSGPVVVGSS